MKHPIGLGKSRSTGLRGVAEVPEHSSMDDRGEIHFVSETMRVLLIGQDLDRQRQPAPGQHGDETLAAKRADEAHPPPRQVALWAS